MHDVRRPSIRMCRTTACTTSRASGASPKKLRALVDGGILDIREVPGDFELTLPQRHQAEAVRTRQPYVDPAPLGAFLDEIRYPIAFLDYETYPCALPRFPRYSPYNHVPFQFLAAHGRTAGRGGRASGIPVHGKRRVRISRSSDALKAALPAEGSIIAWNKPFERGINAKLAERLPSEADWLAAINARFIDLMDVFSDQMVVHPRFRGKTSIKWVLPALVPQLSYKGLAIRRARRRAKPGTPSSQANWSLTRRRRHAQPARLLRARFTGHGRDLARAARHFRGPRNPRGRLDSSAQTGALLAASQAARAAEGCAISARVCGADFARLIRWLRAEVLQVFLRGLIGEMLALARRLSQSNRSRSRQSSSPSRPWRRARFALGLQRACRARPWLCASGQVRTDILQRSSSPGWCRGSSRQVPGAARSTAALRSLGIAILAVRSCWPTQYRRRAQAA